MRRIYVCVLAGLLCLASLTGCGIVSEVTATSKQADKAEYYGIADDEAAVFYGGEQLEGNAIIRDGVTYLPYDEVYSDLDKRFYWDGGEELLFTDAAEIRSETVSDSTVAIVEEDNLYISTDCLEKYLDADIEIFEDPGRVYIDPAGTEFTSVAVKKNTEVRTLGGYKSPILCEISKGDSVYLLEEYSKWAEVRTEDGYIGYMLLKCLNRGEESTQTVASDKDYAGYESVSLGETVCLIWQDMENSSGNSVFGSLIDKTKGVNVVSPAWLALNDNEGNFKDLTSASYVQTAHEKGMQVWVLVDDFDQNMSVSTVLMENETRQKLVSGLVNAVTSVGADGINVDFEYISDNSGKSFIQFLRELYIKCREEGLILSVDNKNPSYVRYCYDMEEQGKIADYVILMGYDEHYAGSEAGSVASISYVQEGIDNALEMVVPEKIIEGLPFYTRIWTEVPAEYAEAGAKIWEDGNSEYESYALSSAAVSMDEAKKAIDDAGVQAEWSEECGQYYAEIPLEHGKKRIWLEDSESMQLKLSKVNDCSLAGVAFWRLGMDNEQVWDVVNEYLEEQP